ncbi:hypothetical protein [uncultured Gammaproteobacteria bacterium]|jgi:hypothetical protein|nr:hypothetical protein BROOK1789B_1161 [Bathymodiolus brooksi thiotrophic gill symbiont]CAC9545142.1 hypothetical protein [uncultured Gammaproteobacteria bacterium]CAB9543948.1 hypothetical protein BROOK1789C_1317 [Bathymodiolus brooksi thiotrophic gill symbiont]CAC9553414.1 hypothetical protein [uncultured Gammaproteobacteria bacterium]CAC9561297.1 hypothetical protein [uncultured Gammaproteobacteria bacterium]
MNMNRRKFLGKTLLLGSSVSLATYVLGKTTSLATPNLSNDMALTSATYANTAHNRQFYSSARF